MKIKRYSDNCYAVVRGNRRGPCAPDRPRAIRRYRQSGLVAFSGTDNTRTPANVLVTLQGMRGETVYVRRVLDEARRRLGFSHGITFRVQERSHG